MGVRVGGYREWCCRISGVEPLGGTELVETLTWGRRRGQKMKAMRMVREADKNHQAADSIQLDHLTFGRML